MGTTRIEWTDRVWNPVTGCTKVSQGCKNCYAESIANRFWATQYPPHDDGSPRKFTDVRCHPERLKEPLTWMKPARVFVNSMSDLFHEAVPDEFIAQVFGVMDMKRKDFDGTVFQILTKRPERMQKWVSRWYDNDHVHRLSNVWLGVSVEDQKAADNRIPYLIDTPAAVRFLSCEPLLDSIDLVTVHNSGIVSWLDLGIHWVIAGCESGPHARPAEIGWFRSLRDQCWVAGVPFFLKQMVVDGKVAKTPELDWYQWVEYPEKEA